MTNRTTRASTGAAVFTAVVLSTAVSVVPAGATPQSPTTATDSPAGAAAGWLARQMVGTHHDHYVDVYQGKSYPDYGSTADAILAMDAAGVAGTRADAATAWLAGHIAGYADDTCTPSQITYYPGSLGKAMVVAEAEHKNPHSFGGQNLVAELKREQTPSGQPNAGLYADPNTTCGYQSPITQSFALIGLSGTGRGADRPSDVAIRWLVRQQCADGGFLGELRRPSGGCQRGEEDVDTTGFATQALARVGGREGAGAAARQAARWLKRRQRHTGGFGQPPAGTNANTTAIAVQGLLAGGDRHAAARGQAWLARHQEGCAAPAGRRGSIDYQSGYDATSQLVATTQGGQALAGGVLGRIDGSGQHGGAPRLACPH